MPRSTKTSAHQIAARSRYEDITVARVLPEPLDRLTTESRLIRTWIDAKTLAQEPSLQQLAWVEYRYMNPLQRTEAFARAYSAAYIAAYTKHFSEEDATKKRPINPVFVRNDLGVMNALWTARASADAAGMPYDLYLETVFDGHLLRDKWKRPPRPNQLYGKLAFPRTRDMPTAEQIAARLYGPGWNPRFFAEAYSGDPVQEAAITLMKDVVAKAPDPTRALELYLCDRRAVTVQRASEIFGKEAVDHAIAAGGGEPVTAPPRTASYVPACFGHPDGSEESVCMACPVSRQCVQFTRHVADDLIRVTGSDDPRKAWKRESAKLRKRRQRKREQLGDMQQTLATVFGEAEAKRMVEGGSEVSPTDIA